MLIAVANVSGLGSGLYFPLAQYFTKGSEPFACTATSFGIFLINSNSCASFKAFPNAEVLPRFPAGVTIQSGDSHLRFSRSSKILFIYLKLHLTDKDCDQNETQRKKARE